MWCCYGLGWVACDLGGGCIRRYQRKLFSIGTSLRRIEQNPTDRPAAYAVAAARSCAVMNDESAGSVLAAVAAQDVAEEAAPLEVFVLSPGMEAVPLEVMPPVAEEPSTAESPEKLTPKEAAEGGVSPGKVTAMKEEAEVKEESVSPPSKNKSKRPPATPTGKPQPNARKLAIPSSSRLRSLSVSASALSDRPTAKAFSPPSARSISSATPPSARILSASGAKPFTPPSAPSARRGASAFSPPKKPHSAPTRGRAGATAGKWGAASAALFEVEPGPPPDLPDTPQTPYVRVSLRTALSEQSELDALQREIVSLHEQLRLRGENEAMAKSRLMEAKAQLDLGAKREAKVRVIYT